MRHHNQEVFCILYCGACYFYLAGQRGTLAEMAAWLAEQASHRACPSCGTPESWYETACTHCGADLPAGDTFAG